MLRLAQWRSILCGFFRLAGAFTAGRPAPVIPDRSMPRQPDRGAPRSAPDSVAWANVMTAYDELERRAVASGADVVM